MHPDKLKSIQDLSPQDRYGYFIRKVADFEEVWLIHDDGQYVTLGDKENQIAFPFGQRKNLQNWR